MNTRSVQELLGHNDVKTTQIYTHVLNQNAWARRSGGLVAWDLDTRPYLQVNQHILRADTLSAHAA